jgi:hypothetical protein
MHLGSENPSMQLVVHNLLVNPKTQTFAAIGLKDNLFLFFGKEPYAFSGAANTIARAWKKLLADCEVTYKQGGRPYGRAHCVIDCPDNILDASALAIHIFQQHGANLIAQRNCPGLLALHEARMEEKKLKQRQEEDIRRKQEEKEKLMKEEEEKKRIADEKRKASISYEAEVEEARKRLKILEHEHPDWYHTFKTISQLLGVRTRASAYLPLKEETIVVYSDQKMPSLWLHTDGRYFLDDVCCMDLRENGVDDDDALAAFAKVMREVRNNGDGQKLSMFVCKLRHLLCICQGKPLK